ncbi:MAG: HAD domain-containing protein [Gracilimonas sp.]|uniref:HAD domain-containing protein n=1 Tax=Gracilimonas sp. TaxID=1974203 RepID=UPI00375065F3|nr:HAD domain-containing protein [Gracilimonas sp.]
MSSDENIPERKLTLFVNIDGVLNTEAHLRKQIRETGRSTSRNWCPVAMAHLKLLVEYYNGQIVVSSTWRYDHSLRQLKELFEKNGLPGKFVIGVTPSLTYENSGSANRGDEIRRWITENLYTEEIPRYAILDDMDEGLSRFGERFIQCDPKVGLADKEKVKRVAGLV